MNDEGNKLLTIAKAACKALGKLTAKEREKGTALAGMGVDHLFR